jgi:molybdenum cofactor guanylyltransferase
MAGTVAHEPGAPSAPIGVVLAGGAGRRMGGDKATVELDGRPLLAYPVAALQAAVGEVAVVAKRETALPSGLDPRVRVWIEPDEPRHPLAGVLHALRQAPGRALIVLAGDLPLVDRQTLRALAEVDARGSAGILPSAGGRLHPLCARYDPPALAGLERADFESPAQRIAEQLGMRVLEWPDERPFFNVNAPEDLLTASALLSRR